MFAKLGKYKESAEKTVSLATSKLRSIFTYRKRTRSVEETDAEEEEVVAKPAVKRMKSFTNSHGFKAMLPPMIPPPPLLLGKEIQEMAVRCQPQRSQVVDMLWTTCKHLFSNDVFARYTIFSLSVYLFDAFTLHQFLKIENRSMLCKFSNASIYNTNCHLAPPWPICCLIMAAKIDTAHSVRVYRVFEEKEGNKHYTKYYFETHKYYDSRTSMPESYVIFESDNKEGKGYRFVNCVHLDENAHTYTALTHPSTRISFQNMHKELLVPAYSQYLRNFELYLLTYVLPFHDNSVLSKYGVEWIFPNPCLYRQELLKSGEAAVYNTSAFPEKSCMQIEEENVLFERIGEEVRKIHQSKFSFSCENSNEEVVDVQTQSLLH